MQSLSEPTSPKANPKLKFVAKGNRLRQVNPAKVPVKPPENVPRYMTATRRAKLEGIRDAHNRKAKKERLYNIIVKKMLSVFGPRNLGIIESFVDEFVATREESINSTELKRLENELRQIIAYRGTVVPKVKSKEKIEVKEEIPEVVSSPKLSLPTDIAWKAMYAYQATLAEREERAIMEADRVKKSRLREELNRQMEVSRQIAKQQRADDVAFAKHVMEDVEKYKLEEDAKIKVSLKKAEEQKRFREEQIIEQDKRKQAEREAALEHERANLEACQRAIDREQEMLLEKKQFEIDRQKRILAENEEHRLYRLEQKRLEGEYDQKLMRDYAAKMDREAEERENAFAKRMANLEAFGSKFSNEGAGKIEKEEMLRQERLLLAEQARKEKADAMEEKRRKDLARKRQQDAARANLKMIEEQKERARREKELDQKLIAMSEAELAKWRKSEEARLRKIAENKIKFKSVLSAQINEKSKVGGKLSDMTDMEYIINKQAIKEIENSSEDVQQAIRKRLQLA